MIDDLVISWEIAFRWWSLDYTDEKSTMVKVMAWCRHAPNYYLSQSWLSSMLTFGVTRPQWVNTLRPGFALTQKSAFFTQILRAGRKNDKLHAFWGRKFHKSMKIQTAHLAHTTCQYGPAVNNKRSFTETTQTKIAPLSCNRHIIPYQILSIYIVKLTWIRKMKSEA